MATAARGSRPVWFVAVAVLAVLWNAFGFSMYLRTVGVFGDPSVGMSEADRAMAAAVPAWIIGVFAIATLAGLVGSLGLLIGKSWAQPVLIVSLVFSLVLEGWEVFLMGAPDGIALPAAVSLVAILLAVLATHARRRGWLT